MRSYHYLAILTIIFWSLAYILTRLALNWFSPFTLGFLRYFIASAALAPFILKMQAKRVNRREALLIVSSGISGFFLYMIVFNLGQAKVTAAMASLIISTVPVFTALFARAVYGEHLSSIQWAAVAIELCGVAIMTGLEAESGITGISWLLLAALLLSFYNILQRSLVKSCKPVAASVYSIFCGTLMLAVFAPQALVQLSDAPGVDLIYLFILGLGSSAIAYVAWTKAFAIAPKTAYVSNYMFLTPFLAALFGYILGDEIPDKATLIGGMVIMAGMLLFNLTNFWQSGKSL